MGGKQAYGGGNQGLDRGIRPGGRLLQRPCIGFPGPAESGERRSAQILRFDPCDVLAARGAAFGSRVENAKQYLAKADGPSPFACRRAGRCDAGSSKPGGLTCRDRRRRVKPINELAVAGNPLGSAASGALPGIAEIDAQRPAWTAKCLGVRLYLGAPDDG